MKILITGAAGFIGQLTAKKLLSDPDSDHTLVLTDIIEPPIPKGVARPQNAKCIKADLSSEVDKVVDDDLDAAYIFHGIMSSGSEADFDGGMKGNFDTTRDLLLRLRKLPSPPLVIYASSQAVYGGTDLPLPITEAVHPTPESSYGAEKMMCEYLINEYHRRNFIKGLILRFPTVSVRPGKPTQAASSFFSGIVREPMQGKECLVPIKNRDFRHWICSPKVLVENLVYALEVLKRGDEKDGVLTNYFRVVNHPGIGVSVQDMIDSLARVGGEDKLKYIREEEDEAVKRILYSWPADFDNEKALKLGFKRDKSFDDAVRDFKEGLESGA